MESLPSQAAQIPERMVKDDQHLGKLVEHRDEFAQVLAEGVAGVGGEFGHDVLDAIAGQVVDSEVKNRLLEGNRPLQGKRDVPGLVYFPQHGGRFDRVMVGERDQAAKPQNIFDLVSLRLVSQLGGQWRRPVGGGQIDGDARSLVLTFKGPAQQGPSLGKFLYETEALLRAVGVTVKRDRSLIVPGHIRRVPKAGKLGLRQSQFVLRPRSCRPTLPQFGSAVQ